jgi:multidrug efflux system outer membrane protein
MIAAALVFSGCTMIPHYERSAAPIATNYARASAVNSNLPAAELSWTNFIAEARLAKLIALALINNRDLRVAVLKNGKELSLTRGVRELQQRLESL